MGNPGHGHVWRTNEPKGEVMVLPEETIGKGAPKVCEDCGVRLVPQIMFTCAYYIGTQCNCGPYSRESEYFKTEKEAQKVLDGMIYGRVNPEE